jgi:Mrp family chromosome partitioning ATPase
VLADGVLLVVRSGETPKEAFTRARDLLASVKCRLLGVVLNAVDASAPDYYYSYRYYPYSYGYGPQESAEIHEVEDQDSVEQRSSRYSNDDSQSL